MNYQTLNSLFSDLNIELEDELSDLFNSGHDEISDFAHESADGDADVIYYSKAEALYNAASQAERDEAESTIEDCGGFGEDATMSSRFTVLAYWITYNRLMEALRTQASDLVDVLEEQSEKPEVRRLWGEVIDEVIEVLEAA
ncbi:MAG: hypothetical protein DRH97_00795 [Chloroflexi bacterium]|nr:MAG: hypothetical protein DRH97_00795 [Chloroflexota bacterium]